MKNNFMKECTTSFVVYIQDKLVEEWKKVLEINIEIYRIDKCRVIFKMEALVEYKIE